MGSGAAPGRNETEIARLVAPHCEAMGYELVRVRFTGGHRPTLQVMAEPRERRPMGIEDCTALSRHLSAVLDVEDAVAGSYVLEVSSPGIDRPLVKRGDYERFMGHEAKIELAQPLDGRRRFRGRIRGLDGDALRVELSEGGTVELPLAGIAAAKLVLTDEAIAAAQKEGRV